MNYNNGGKIAITPMGDYDASVTYPRLSCVRYSGGVYLSKKETTGNTPAKDNEWWMFMVDNAAAGNYVRWTDIATSSALGISKPDGDTITVDANGTLSVPTRGTSRTYTLLASNWDLDKAYMLYDSNIKASSDGILGVPNDATAAERDALRDAMITITRQALGVIVLACDGEVPMIDVNVRLVIF